jgi:hypothetical protein
MSDTNHFRPLQAVNEGVVETLVEKIGEAVLNEIERVVEHVGTYHGSRPFSEVVDELGVFSTFRPVVGPVRPLIEATLSVSEFEDGTPDRTTIADVVAVLDELEVPAEKKDWLGDKTFKRMTVAGRVHLLGDLLEEEKGANEELRSEADVVSQDFEKDLWRSTRRILDKLKFDWSQVGSDGVTAEAIEDFIIDSITALERKARPKQKPLPIETTGPLPGKIDA